MLKLPQAFRICANLIGYESSVGYCFSLDALPLARAIAAIRIGYRKPHKWIQLVRMSSRRNLTKRYA
jgi:hypothetical protein